MAKKRNVVSKEQADRESLEFRLKDLRQSFHKIEPTLRYKVGERVQRGCVKSSIVTEVLDDGQILKLHEIYTDTNYGRPLDYERDDYVLWHQVVPYRTFKENDAIPIFVHKSDIQLNYSQRDLSGFFTTVYSFGLDMDPEYQRGNVWNIEDKVALIDSIFNDVDIGKFVFILLEYSNECIPLYEILDGKQRISAIIDFHENRFAYKGKLYHELNRRDQNHFENYSISWAEVKNVTLKQKLEYFLRLNTSGKPQDPEHMKKIRRLCQLLTDKFVGL
jgi:Protein of unknown function DUF262.